MSVYDLLASPDCLPDLLQGKLKSKGQDEAFLLSSFRLHNKAPTSLFSVINPKDNTKYLDFSVQAKQNKGDLSNSRTHGTISSFNLFHSLFPVHCPSLDFYFLPSAVAIRYLRTDGRFGTTSFNHASLADGRIHHVMLHARGLQRGPPHLYIYIDCTLAHSLDHLPAAFGSLPPGPNKVALRTLQSSGQVNSQFIVSLY